jgi:tripartite-type tricarboxylate transporter receptor subunit TctC
MSKRAASSVPRVLRCAGLAVLLAGLGLFASVTAHGQSFPGKPVRLLVGSAPGSAPDILARILGQRLSEHWGQSVIVENRPGAAGNLGAQQVAASPADGYTLMLATAAYSVSIALYRNLGFDPLKDLVGVSLVAEVPLILVVSPSLEVRTIDELVATLRSRPTVPHYASPGNGTLQHLVTEQFKRVTGVRLEHVPYKSGAHAVNAVLSGETVLFFAGMPPALPLVKSGRLRAVAVTTKARFGSAPEVPTMAEAGLRGFEADNWHGVLVPAGVPASVIAQLNEGIRAALRHPDVVKRFLEVGAAAAASSPGEFQQLIVDDAKRWGVLASELQLKLD